MTVPAPERIDQQAYWNGVAGQKWIDFQDTLDSTFAPVLRALVTRAAVRPGERIIDVGCGCGASSVDLAQLVGPGGEVVGVDISAEMLARARARAPATLPVSYLLADAAAHAFPPGASDLLFSRFGVMFFPEPVAAFRNLAAALKPGGRLTFACWRTPRENPFFITALQEAVRFVPRLPETPPDEPGPFAFAAPERVRRILGDAGFAEIAVDPFDCDLDLAAGRGLAHARTVSLSIGPASRALAGHPAETVAAVGDAIAARLAQHQRGDSVLLAGAMWIVTATKG
ncbi:MAG: methyltransferase domain-containing protein [Xanthobacteraceae bacterium]|nr:methyltransferase domain-containing protein [Xanthobacteraceae bacterium]